MKLVIMNETGHTELEVTTSELIEQITDHPTHWVFADGELVSRQDVNTFDWDSVDGVQFVPAVVGGNL